MQRIMTVDLGLVCKFFRTLGTRSLTYLSHDVAVIQCITSCNKNHMTTLVITV